MINLTALRTELQTDPAGLGYANAVAGSDYAGLVALLNLERPAVRVNRSLVPAHEFVNALAPGEYVALTQAQRDYLVLVAAAGQVQLGGGGVRVALTALFPANSPTRAALLALLDRPASRADFLFGQAASFEDVVAAVRGSL